MTKPPLYGGTIPPLYGGTTPPLYGGTTPPLYGGTTPPSLGDIPSFDPFSYTQQFPSAIETLSSGECLGRAFRDYSQTYFKDALERLKSKSASDNADGKAMLTAARDWMKTRWQPMVEAMAKIAQICL